MLQSLQPLSIALSRILIYIYATCFYVTIAAINRPNPFEITTCHDSNAAIAIDTNRHNIYIAII